MRRKQAQPMQTPNAPSAVCSNQPPAPTLPTIAQTTSMAPTAAAMLQSSLLQAPVPAPHALPAAAKTASTMPATIAEMAGMVNRQLGRTQQRHHITDSQAAQLQKAFGEVKLLLGLLSADDSSLNEVFEADGSLHAMQIVAVRRVLHSLHQ